MSKKEFVTVESNVVEEPVTEEVKEETEMKEKKNVLKKGAEWIKGHSKTIAKGVGVAALGIIAYGLGKHSAGSNSDSDDSDVIFDPNDGVSLEDSDVTE